MGNVIGKLRHFKRPSRTTTCFPGNDSHSIKQNSNEAEWTQVGRLTRAIRIQEDRKYQKKAGALSLPDRHNLTIISASDTVEVDSIYGAHFYYPNADSSSESEHLYSEPWDGDWDN